MKNPKWKNEHPDETTVPLVETKNLVESVVQELYVNLGSSTMKEGVHVSE